MKGARFLLVAALCGCAPRESGPLSPTRGRVSKPAQAQAAAGAQALSSVLLTNVPAGTFGPYLGVANSSAIVVWLAAENEARRSFFSLALGDGAKPAGQRRRLADAPGDIGLVAVRPSSAGFVVLSTHRTAGGEAIEALSLGPAGELRGGPTSLAQPQGEVLWIESLPTARGALAFWAVRRDDRADLYAAALGPTGNKLAAAEPVARGARAWQAAAIDGGAALATVRPGAKGETAGPVEVVFVSADAKPRATPAVVSSAASAELDVDMVAAGDRLVLAWSDRRKLEPQLYLAALDRSGAVVTPPAPATPGVGEQALVRLVPPFEARGPAYLAWENLMQRPRSGRAIEVAPLDAEGRLGEPRARLHFVSDDGSMPELAASPRGLAALTLAPACARGQPCTDATPQPTFVEFSPELRILASEPVRLASRQGELVPLAWGLGCRAIGCVSLAALSSTPAPVFAVRLEPRSKHWQPAAEGVKRPPPPRALSIEAIAAPDPLSEVTAARVGSSTLVGYVTYFDPTTPWVRLKKPAPDGRYDPLRALLEVRSLPDDAGASRPPNVVSLRARSIAGVALAAGAPEHREALLVWGAVDNAQPQVFATLLGEDGKKLRQRMLTRAPGEKSEVAAVFVGDGYLVAWVDERHGDPEVYVTKVDRALRQVGQERRITQAPGSATGLSLLARGKEALLVWADAREGEQPGFADIWLTRLRASDAAPAGEEQRLLRTRPHSHSPVLSPSGNAVVVAWLEEQPEGPTAGGGAGVRIGRLDQDGRFLEAPDIVAAAGGAPTSLAVDCVGSVCHVVMSVDVAGKSELQALPWAPTQPPRVVPLATLTGPHGQSVSPVLIGPQLFYGDQAGSRGRVRRLAIEWQ